MNIIIHAPSSKAVSQAFARDLATALRDAGTTWMSRKVRRCGQKPAHLSHELHRAV